MEIIRDIEVTFGTIKFAIKKLNYDQLSGAIKVAQAMNENNPHPNMLVRITDTMEKK